MNLLFLTPDLPPRVCGVGDHTLRLAAALGDLGWSPRVVAPRGDPDAAPPGWGGRFARWSGGGGDLVGHLRAHAAGWLWVQLSGYGYSRGGAPRGLAAALREVARRRPDVGIAVCVHEVHCAPAQLGRGGAILSAWQRRTIGAVVRRGHVVLPTMEAWRQTCLRDYRVEPARVTLLPAGSNLPPVERPAAARTAVRGILGIGAGERVGVVFGRRDSQQAALERFADPGRWPGRLDRVLVTGGGAEPPGAGLRRLLAGAPWRGLATVLPEAPAADIARTIAACDVGLVPTPWPWWEKSGAARACQQAGLDLWIPDGDALRAHRPGPPPAWADIARIAAGALEAGAPGSVPAPPPREGGGGPRGPRARTVV